jgi:winged helix-turn helix protein
VAVLSMSKQEFSRLDVLLRVQSGCLRVSDACVRIGLQRRQVFRLLRGLKQDGAASLLSKRRGQPSNHRLPAEVRTLALSIVRERYPDFGPTLAAEKLAEHHGCSVSRETLRGWMIADGLWQDRRHRVASPHQPRRRRDCLGELVQIDGSEHAWFEDRGPPCTLLAFVDDATSRLMQLRFVTSESAFDYFRTTRAYLEEHGKPVALYSDKHGIFRVNRKEAVGGDGVTQFGRALLALNIDIMPTARRRRDASSGPSAPCRIGWSRSCGWRGYRPLPRRMHGCLGSSLPTTRASAGIRRMPRTCIGRWRKPMIWTRSWLGGRSAQSRAT